MVRTLWAATPKPTFNFKHCSGTTLDEEFVQASDSILGAHLPSYASVCFDPLHRFLKVDPCALISLLPSGGTQWVASSRTSMTKEYLTVLSFPGTIPFPMEYWSVALGGTYPGGRSHYDVPSEMSFSSVPRNSSRMITVVCVPGG